MGWGWSRLSWEETVISEAILKLHILANDLLLTTLYER